jgi:hypothetical protein
MPSRPDIRKTLLSYLNQPSSIEDCLNHVIEAYRLGGEFLLTEGETSTSTNLSTSERVGLKTTVRQELATMKRLDLLIKVRHGVYIKR